MRKLPRAAQIYVWAVILSGGLVFVATAWECWTADFRGMPRAQADRNLWLLLLGCVASFAASFLKVTVFVPGKARRDRKGNISLGFVPTFFLLFGLGPFYAIAASVVNVVTMTSRPRQTAYYQVLFSAGAITLSVAAAATVLRLCGLEPADWQRFTFATASGARLALDTVGIGLTTTVYSLASTGMVALAIALSSGRRPADIWRAHYRWVIPCYFAGASCASIAFGLAPLLAEHPWASLAVGCIAAPIPGVIYLVYRYHLAQEEASLAHIEDLERHNAELERSRQDLTRSRDELERMYTSTVESLALAIDAKDRYTKEHIQRVKETAVAIGLRLGLGGDDLRALETGSLLHDIGKLAIPEHILSKPGRLSADEFAKVKLHPDMGAKILEPVHFPFPVMPIVRGHHERWDGQGYPDGLKGEEIPLGARILAVADVYDALTSDRPYRAGWSRERALDHIRESAGAHFDPAVVAAFLEVAAESRAGSGGIAAAAAAAPAVASAPPGPSATPDAPAGAAPGRAGVTEEINRASFEYLSLYEISQTASVTLELAETRTLLANKLRLLFNASSCVLMLAEGQDGGSSSGGDAAAAPMVLRCAAASGVDEAAFARTRVRIGVGPSIGVTERVARGRRGALGAYEPQDLEYDAGAAAEAEGDGPPFASLRTAMVVPLAVDAGAPVLGTINLYHERADAFDAEDLRVLQTISAQAARALENAREFDRTRRSAMTDALTGLYNARHLAHFLDRELPRARAAGQPLTVLVLDLDGFKRVNDRFGHPRGNEVLRDLGRAIQNVLGGGDLVTRYAGDEYVVVLPGVGAEAVPAVTDRIRGVVQHYDGRPVGDAGRTAASDGAEASPHGEDPLDGLRIGISIGAASFPEDATDAAALIARADRAMYRDKEARREHEERSVRHLLADVGPLD